MKRFLRTLLLLTIVISTGFLTANATHLMGGNLYYEYTGTGPGGFNFHVTLKLYRYCSGNPTPTPLPNSMELGAYNENPSAPGADKILQASYTMPLISSQIIQPPNANDSCAFLPNECVEEGIYEIDITLPASTGGYHLIADRCCRNVNIVNVANPNNTGMVWYAFIPPTSTANSSPTFSVAPVPFICANDTVSILNAASDPDGDSLDYQFVWPYWGISDGGNSNPGTQTTYPWTIPLIAYTPGYSFAQPFGAGGYSYIDPLTGLTSYLSPSQGFFVVAVEIKEFRNGVLVGVTRRDLQLIFITCPVNPAPVTTNSTFTYTINEGQSLCFNVGFTDPNGDSLYMSHVGAIFNGLITNPPATLTDVNGLGSINSQFCWNTTCDQGRPTPYQFSATATDNGCPAKVSNVVFTINVIPFHGTQNIVGPDSICSNSLTGIVYSTTGQLNSTYNWTVVNGTQVGGGSTNTATVNWNATGPYFISVTEVNSLGCKGDTIIKSVFISPLPTANAGNAQTLCSGLTTTIGSSSTPGYSYSWSPSTGLSSSTISDPVLTASNTGTNPITVPYIVSVNLNGCINKDTVLITINPSPLSNAGSNQVYCTGSNASIGGPSTPGYTYSWSPATGLSNATVSNPTVTIISPGTTVYTVTTTNTYGCTSTDDVQIVVNALPVVTAAASPLTICAGQQVSLTGTGANTYSWATTTNPGTPIGTGALLLVNPTATTSYIVTGTSTLNCQNSDTVTVNVNALPNVIATALPDSICLGDSVTLSVVGANTYSWANANLPGTPIGTGTSIVVSPTVTTSYIVTGIATLTGCQNKDTITVHVVNPPISNAGTDQPLCSGSTITLGTGTISGNTYSWSPSTGLSSTSISNPILTLTNLGNAPDTVYYTVITTNSFGCISEDEVMIIVNPVPTANAGGDVIFCSGQSAVIGAPQVIGYAYSWSPATGLTPPNGNNPTITLTNGGSVNDTIYYVLTTTWYGCIDKDTVQVIVKPLPGVTAGPDQTICSGNTVQLGGASLPGYTYSWSPATNLSSTTASNPSAVLTATGAPASYTYVVTALWNGCENSDTVTILVNDLPNVIAAAIPSAICIGASSTIAATGASTYSWALASNPGTPIGTGSSLTVTPTVTTTYIVTGTSSVNCDNIATVTVTVNPLPVVTATAPADSICFGDSILLTGNGATNYSWEINGLPGTISSNATVWVSPATATSYIVTGSDVNGCENKDTIDIFVNPAATLAAIFGVDYACPGVVGDLYWVINPNSSSTYIWTITGGTITGGQGTDTITVDWGQTGIGVITCYETTDHGCSSDPVTFVVTINPILTPPQPSGANTICANLAQGLIYSTLNSPGSVYTWGISGGVIVNGQGTSSVTVNWNPLGPATAYLWFEEQSNTVDTTCFGISDTLVITINPVPQTSAITGPVKLCQNDSTNLSVINTSGSGYQWTANGGTILNGQGSNLVNVQWTTAGTYSVYVIETNQYGCIGDTVNYNLVINPLPIANAGIDKAICIGDSITLYGTGGTSFLWTPAGSLSNSSVSSPIAFPSVTTTYTITVTNNNNCKNTDSATVTVNPLPVVNAGSDVSICRGQSANLQATPGGAAGYFWTPAGSLNNNSIDNPVATPFNTVTYYVTVTDGNSCKNKDSVKVTVNPLPIIKANTIDTIICDGTSAQLNANGATSYSWNPAASLDNPNIASPSASPSTTTIYTVIGTDNNGCTNSDEVKVIVKEQPIASFTYSDTANCDGIRVEFTNTSQFGTNYVWNFGDGSQVGYGENASHAFNFGYSGTIQLIVFNGICSDTSKLDADLGVFASYMKDIPNVFSPNGDGINDCFNLDRLGDFRFCTEYKIFDRWGRLVYSSADKTAKKKCWDGEDLHGNECPNGTYIFLIDVAGYQLKGTVTLLRNGK